MAEIKKISTEFQPLDKFLDTSGDAGTANQVLVSTATGVDWVDGSGSSIIGGPYLPIAGGALTGGLTGTTASFSGNVAVQGTGNLTIRNTTSAGSGIVFIDTTWQAGIEHNSGKLFFRTGGQNDRMIINSNGSVGIGTTSPNAPLSVHNTASTLGSRVASFYHNNGSENPFIEINSLSDGMQLKAGFTTGLVGHLDILTGGGSSFITLSPGSSEKMRITSAGDTGIGVTTPRAKLDVAGGVKVADDTDGAALNKVGTLRYRYVPGSPKNYSYVDMCMQTGTSSYAWVNIVQNVW